MELDKNKIKYEDYRLEDFLVDEFFIEWVKNPNENNRHFWEKWTAEHPEKRGLVITASNWIKRLKYKNQPELSDRSYVKIFENVMREGTKESPTPTQIAKKSLSKWLFSFRQIAAILVIGISILFFWQKSDLSKPSTTDNRPVPEIIYRKAPLGSKAIFVLEDGSKVYLNAGSELWFPKTFEQDKRKVQLKGEAFFEVVKNSKPFLVSSSGIEVKVLGTSFNVKESEKGDLSVALVSGKIQINDQKGNRLMLEPKEMMVFNPKGEFFKTGFDLLEITGWKDKILVFSSNSIQEVKTKLEAWYGIELDINGNFPSNWAYSGIYNDETLENVLKGISLSSRISFSLNGKKATLTHE